MMSAPATSDHKRAGRHAFRTGSSRLSTKGGRIASSIRKQATIPTSMTNTGDRTNRWPKLRATGGGVGVGRGVTALGVGRRTARCIASRAELIALTVEGGKSPRVW